MSGQNVKHVTVLGAGTMGHGIAQVCAQSGIHTVLFDVHEAQLEKAKSAITKNLGVAVEKGKLSADDKTKTLALLSFGTRLTDAVSKAEVVVEAVPEQIELKKKLFAEVGDVVPHAILGTNTSSLSVTEIASAAKNPERVVGMHFFNPPYILKLLEIVKAQQTSTETLAKTQAFGTQLGREMIVVADSPGFATSRLGLVLGLEAIRMLESGVGSAEDIDKAMELGYRHPMGPLRLTDLVGLDVRLAIAEYLHRELGGEQFRPPPLLRKMVRAGKLGKKSGEGFYKWG